MSSTAARCSDLAGPAARAVAPSAFRAVAPRAAASPAATSVPPSASLIPAAAAPEGVRGGGARPGAPAHPRFPYRVPPSAAYFVIARSRIDSFRYPAPDRTAPPDRESSPRRRLLRPRHRRRARTLPGSDGTSLPRAADTATPSELRYVVLPLLYCNCCDAGSIAFDALIISFRKIVDRLNFVGQFACRLQATGKRHRLIPQRGL